MTTNSVDRCRCRSTTMWPYRNRKRVNHDCDDDILAGGKWWSGGGDGVVANSEVDSRLVVSGYRSPRRPTMPDSRSCWEKTRSD